MSDPLRSKIVQALNEPLDAHKFERCMMDLLRPLYPYLVPIEGGNDAGYDGDALPPDGKRIQFACTSGADVLRNLRKSLREAKKKGQISKEVVMVTSRKITNAERRKLSDCARENGLALHPVRDQADVVNLLYRDSAWRKDLLGIPGNPSALSLLPANHRPRFDLEPIGREAELKALGEAADDLVIAGQPGTGKTHLLMHAAAKSNGLFVVSTDQGLIADGVRDQRPEWLIVDDAFTRLKELQELRQTRKDTGERFRIMASCWPGQEEAVWDALGLPGRKAMTLERLSDAQILEIVKGLEIFGPDHLLSELLHQAQSKPGLAVTLCQMIWQNGTKELLAATALSRDVRLSLVRFAGQQAVTALSYFALAGGTGLTVEEAAALSGLPAAIVADITVTIAAAGVLEVAHKNRLTVEPARLRQAFVKDVFCTGKAGAPAWPPLLERLPDRADGLETVIVASFLGGKIDDATLRAEVVKMEGSRRFPELCARYAGMGKAESGWLLDTHPDLAETAAEALLLFLPTRALPVLLMREMAQPPARQERDELKEVRKWIDAVSDTKASLPRRMQLLAAVEKLGDAFKDTDACLAAIRIVLGISFEWIGQAPGEPNAIRIQHGFVPFGVLDEIAELWPRGLKFLIGLSPERAAKLSTLVDDWACPRPWGGQVVPPAYVKKAGLHARRMVGDLVKAYEGNWPALNALGWVAERAKVRLPELNGLAGILFPRREPREAMEEMERDNAAVVGVAAEWVLEADPSAHIDEWLRLDREAGDAGRVYPNLSWNLAHLLASKTNNPVMWIDLLVDRKAPVGLVEPFIVRMGSDSVEGARWLAQTLLAKDPYQVLVVELVVRFVPINDPLWEEARGLMAPYAEAIGLWVLRRQVPEAALAKLLKDCGPNVAAKTAENLWSSAEGHLIPAALKELWKAVVVEHVADFHSLNAISKQEPEVGFAWVRRRLNWPADRQILARSYKEQLKMEEMVPTLSREQRSALIGEFAEKNWDTRLLAALIGHDLDLLKQAIARPETHQHTLRCLDLPGNPAKFWVERAIALLDGGFSEEEVMLASAGSAGGWSGKLSAHHEERRQMFLPLVTEADERIQQIAKKAVAYLEAQRDHALEAERRAAIRGELF